MIISRNGDNLVSSCSVLPALGSDHMLMDCIVDNDKQAPLKVKSTVRNFKTINKVDFSDDLNSAISGLEFRGTVDEMLEQLDSSVVGVLDALAPSQTRSRNLRPRFAWYNEVINDARRVRRKLERKWGKRKMMIDQCYSVNKLIQTAMETYYKNELESSDSRNMYGILNKLLNMNGNVKLLPTCDSMSDLCNSFAQFFNKMVEKIRSDLAKGSDINSANVGTSHSTFNANNVVPFETFKPVSTEDIVKIVRNSSSKSCVLDTLPK